jgi:hypothetical protein
MNEHIKDLRDLGGTRMVVNYTDVVMSVLKGVQEIADDNKVEFQTNLSMYLEGLEEDVLDAKFPHSIGPWEDQPDTQPFTIRPKEIGDE